MIPSEMQARPDIDIEEDINAALRSFSPLKAARVFFKVQSTNGNITVTGNSGSPQAKRVLLDYVRKIPGVISVDLSALYDDEIVRRAVGAMIPEGIQVNVQFGAVVLSSALADGHQDVLRKVRALAGVRQAEVVYYGASTTDASTALVLAS